MAWIRDGESPEKIKVSFVVSTEEHPELAQFILALPYRGTSKILREILSSAVKNAGALPPVMNRPGRIRESPAQEHESLAPHTQIDVSRPASGGPPGVNEVSAAAAGIIENFDKMFPS